uniref:chitin synthase n=1 Tax=Knipowitschia caucasica TaxID=637954 RepID=A0AAV2K3M9_KNICA
MEKRELPKRLWDTFQELPVIEDEQTPWKLIKLVRFIVLCVVALLVFGLSLCSKTAFMLLITMSSEGTKVIPEEQKPVSLLCIGCVLVSSSLLLFLKSIWKACYKTSKFPRISTAALVFSFELVASAGAAILTIVAMPHLDIVTNVSIVNGAAFLSALLQIVAQCTAKERNRFLVPSITALILVLLGYGLFLALYVMKDTSDLKMAMWVGLAVGTSLLMSLNWWENYFGLISEHSSSIVVKGLYHDMRKCRNTLNMFSSLLRMAVTFSVLGAYVPLSQMDWDVVRSIPGPQTRVTAITVGVQLVSSALCHWFSLAACKMHAMRRCFILPLYLSSLSVMALLVVPVIVYYQDYRLGLNGTSTNFTHYCSAAVEARNASLNPSVFPELVYDVSHTLCFLDMSKMSDIGLLTGSAVSWWLGLMLCTIHLWHLSLVRIQRTQDLFVRGLYEGGFIEQSLLLNMRFEVKNNRKIKKFTHLEPVKLFLCATMWHETYDEMMKIIISVFRLDKYRPKTDEKTDLSFEAHVYFDDAFVDVPGSQGRHVNEYAVSLVHILQEVYVIFMNLDKDLFNREQQVPDQTVVRTPYGGRLVVTMPHGNNIIIHFKDKKLIRHKKRWSQVMYMYYLLGWKFATKYYTKLMKGVYKEELIREFEKEKDNTYILALDGDTDFHPAAVMLLVDRLKLYSNVGAVCGRIHPTGSGPMVWYQKFEYAVGHWLQKTAEHVFGSVLCSPGCFSLFRAKAVMDNNVMKRYTIKATKASQHLQYDQGEDRWLCTLMMKQGWRVEYNAAADAYTNAPEEFKEFYNQRRRWGPSTFVNSVDLLGNATLMINRNRSMSRPYIFYQFISLVTSILSPSSVILMITGCLNLLLNIPQNEALVLSIIPPALFLAVSFKVESNKQITIAAVMSCVYAFIMMITFLTVIANMIEDQSIMTPSSLFIVALMCFYVVTALLHPQEAGLVFYGLLYLLCIPSAYLLLSIYSMVNMNNVSWGTRETAPAPGAMAAAPIPERGPLKRALSSLSLWMKKWFCRGTCCQRCRRDSDPETERPLENSMGPSEEAPEELQPQNTIVDDGGPTQAEPQLYPEPVPYCPIQSWVSQVQGLSDDMRLKEEPLESEEQQFFQELIVRYLEPLHQDKKKQEEMLDDLRSLRNKANFVYFIINAMWLVITFSLQFRTDIVGIQIPKVDMNLQPTGDHMLIEPIGVMFILAFALLVLIQFIGMLWHRTYTLIHYIAFLDTETVKFEEPKAKVSKKVEEEVEEEEESDSDSDSDSDELLYPELSLRSVTGTWPTVTNVWLVNLAAADLIFCFTRISSLIMKLFFDHWPFGVFICKLNGFLKYINMFCSVFLLAVISLDRALCVWRPIFTKKKRSLFVARVVAMCVWTLALVFSVPYFAYRRVYLGKNNLSKCSFDVKEAKDNGVKIALYSVRFLCGFLLPFLVILSCYIAAGLGIKRTRLSGKARPLRILVTLVVAFFLCWAPYHCLQLVKMVNSKSLVVKIWHPLASGVAYFNSCVNPILYYCMGVRVRGRFGKSLAKAYERALAEDAEGPTSRSVERTVEENASDKYSEDDRRLQPSEEVDHM